MAIMPRPFATPAACGQKPEGEPLRRCTFRRMTVVEGNANGLPMYDVACTFPDRRRAISLGDVEDARPICHACTYQGIFRADSD